MFSTLLQGHVSDAMRKKIDNTTIIGVPVLDLDGTMPFNFVSSICEDIILWVLNCHQPFNPTTYYNGPRDL